MPSMMSSKPTAAGSSDSGCGGRTALVLEFICLFTHDLRKKQKRWEDGRLRYHTFNKRVMVYDDRGNFVGDLHWTREEEFGEGEEVQLDRGTAIVQVLDCVGRKEQDLSELLDKRAKEKEQRQARLMARRSLAAPSPNTPMAGSRTQDHFQTRHRPLNHLLGTPTGHYGRAVVPTESPFELRQRASSSANDSPDSRPSKRTKREITPPVKKKGYAQNLFGATLSLSAVPISSAPRQPANSIYRQRLETPAQEKLGQGAEQDITDEARQIERPVSGSRGSSDKASINPSSSTTALAVAERTSQEPGENKTRGLNHVESRTCGPSRVEKVVPGPQRRTVELAEPRDQTPISLDNCRPSGASGPIKELSRGKSEETARASSHVFETSCHATSGIRAQAIGVSESGVSCSQVIVLDEDPGNEPSFGHTSLEPQQTVSKANVSLSGAPENGKMFSKRDRVPRTTAKSPVVKPKTLEQDPKDVQGLAEERTELRLKPRKKRGLLVLSEKKNKPKQLRPQGVPADKSNHTGKGLDQPPRSDASEPSFVVTPEDTDLSLLAQQDSTYTKSLVVSETHLGEPDDLPQRAEIHQDSRPEEQVGSTLNHSMSRPKVTPLNESPKTAVNAADSPNTQNGDDIAENAASESLPSPPSRKARPRDSHSKQIHREPDDSGVSDQEESSSEPIRQLPTSRSSRQTRKSRNLDEIGSNRPKKKARIADSDDSVEELSQARDKPRLAKFSKKSVKSREIFGLVPSSPPAILANTVRAFVSVGAPRETSPVLNERPTPLQEPRSSSLSTDSAASIPPAAQKNNLVSDSRAEARTFEVSQREEATTTVMLQSDPLIRTSLACSASDSPSRQSGEDKSMVAQAFSSGHDTIAAAKEASPPATTRPHSTVQERSTTASSSTLRPRSNNEQLRLPKQPQPPISNAPSIGSNSGATKSCEKPHLGAPTAAPTRPRIANPATRGRKAALHSDAAGQVPRPILPADPACPAHAGGMQPLHARSEPAAPRDSERPKRQMRYPGFTSAKGGGPWSREAHDLLENARPG
ncbi:hypothetical protein P885DRAFT_32945 [Corynascus similis CBS 632.67]